MANRGASDKMAPIDGPSACSKILAAAGLGSRVACEELVTNGRVQVNGIVQRRLPVLVDPQRDAIAVDGRPVRLARRLYFLLNKPRNVFCTHHDPSGRTRAVDLVHGVRERLFPVGRLDADATGLLILTNDGELAQRLTHPRYGAPKTYRVEVAGCPTEQTLEKLRAGVWLAEGRSAAAQIEIIHRQRDRGILEITLRESRHREIRRMLARFGHNVRRLHRVRIGKLSIARLPIGACRPLTPQEVAHLRRLVGRPVESPTPLTMRRRASGGEGPVRSPPRRRSDSRRPARNEKRRRIIAP